MNRGEKLSTGPWIVAVALALFVFYPLSIGPMGWVVIKSGSPAWTQPVFEFMLAPLIWLQDFGPAPVSKLLTWYFGLWWT